MLVTNLRNSVNSIFNPSYVDELFSRPSEHRRALLEDARSTNYSVVRLELIEHIYERMYDQRRELGSDSKNWPHRILSSTAVAGVEAEADKIRLIARPLGRADGEDGVGEKSEADEILDCDLVIAATGYQRQAHLSLMEDIADLLPEAPSSFSDAVGAASASASEGLKRKNYEARIGGRPVTVARDYGLQFADGKVAAGSGIWLQGCCEGTHGVG